MKLHAATIVAAMAMLGAVSGAPGGQLEVGSVRGHRGEVVSVPITYKPGAHGAVALEIDVRFNAIALGHPRCEAGPALSGSASVTCEVRRSGLLHIAVVGDGATSLAAGEVARAIFEVSQNAGRYKYPLRQKASASDAAGRDLRVQTRSGAVSVTQ